MNPQPDKFNDFDYCDDMVVIGVQEPFCYRGVRFVRAFSVAFRSAKVALIRGAKGDNGTIIC